MCRGPFYEGDQKYIAASRAAKGRTASFHSVLLGPSRGALNVPDSVLEYGPQKGGTCEEMKPIANAHVGFFDEFNSTAEDQHKVKHKYINPNVFKKLVPSSTERVYMHFHGKYSRLAKTSGKLIRLNVLANHIPITDINDPSVLNRLEVTPFFLLGTSDPQCSRNTLLISMT